MGKLCLAYDSAPLLAVVAGTVLATRAFLSYAPRPAPLQGLLQLFDSNGLPVPLHKCGQCMYRLGPAGCKLSLRLVNGRLMARSGAGQTMDILAWLEKQPAAEQQQRRQQHPSPLR